jgi:iron complex outermembrane receptor protein
VGEAVTVTATGDEESAFKAIQSVTTLDSNEISEKNTQSLGDVLDHEMGVAKRSFGPGNGRPVVRGYQSGDHTEPIDVLSLEKLEVVKGPATLLYGSNAIGGVVNAITGHESAHKGTRGFVTTTGGSNNWQGGGSGGFEYGTDSWLFWGNGSSQRAGNYKTSLGTVPNSYTREGAGSGGAGYFQGKTFFTADYSFDQRRYGIPFDPDEAIRRLCFQPRRYSVNFTGGVRTAILHQRNPGHFQYNDYKHRKRIPKTSSMDQEQD